MSFIRSISLTLLFLTAFLSGATPAGILFFRNKNGTIELLLTKQMGKWGDAGGSAEKNESPMETAAREAAEELALILDYDALQKGKPFTNVDVTTTKTYRSFLDALREQNCLQKTEYFQCLVPWQSHWGVASNYRLQKNKEKLRDYSFLETEEIRWRPLATILKPPTLPLRDTLLNTLGYLDSLHIIKRDGDTIENALNLPEPVQTVPVSEDIPIKGEYVSTWENFRTALPIGIIATAIALYGSYLAIQLRFKKLITAHLEQGTYPLVSLTGVQQELYDAYVSEPTPAAKKALLGQLISEITHQTPLQMKAWTILPPKVKAWLTNLKGSSIPDPS